MSEQTEQDQVHDEIKSEREAEQQDAKNDQMYADFLRQKWSRIYGPQR